jgi:cobalt-zinc-cadmium resistance protein CzcA
MLQAIVERSIRLKWVVVLLLAILLTIGAAATRSLPIDAVPDLTTTQVSVMTDAPGLSPIEVERTVTFPIEMALNGTPRLTELRSMSRGGLSVVTAIFDDGTDVWRARQIVLERVLSAEAELPKLAGKPALGPATGGLGDIFRFVVRSDQHSPMQLRTLLDWEIGPKIRQVSGVVEVNSFGGDLKEYQIIVDPGRLHAHKITLSDLSTALEDANASVGGGYVERKSESLTLRGVGLLRNEEEIGNVVLRTADDGTPLLVRHVAKVQVGAAMRYGVITRDGEGEAVAGMTLMLLGSNSREVVQNVKDRVAEVQRGLPPGVKIEAVYDRSDFVGRTISTVTKNLIEGAVVVTFVLWLFLGTLRGALVVVLGIPASMSIAVIGMHLFGVTGDLMSLGAIDFGFLVDGPIVMLEATIAALAGKKLVKSAHDATYGEIAGAVARPVAFAVAIIMLVYVPLLTLEGIEGKMFRPMAITMACALFGALVYSVAFFPALLVLCVPVAKDHGPRWIERLTHRYSAMLPWAMRRRVSLLVAAGVALVGSFVLLAQYGADFMPRIEEGDLVVTIRRAPSIGLEQAKELDLASERALKQFPEVMTAIALTGRAEVAVDPVGNDSTDLLVHLRPKKEWTSAYDLDELSILVKAAIEREVPGTFVSVSQPIEDKTNELISGARADVQISVFGEDIQELRRLSDEIASVVRTVNGSGDIRVERLLGAPQITVQIERNRLARYGIKAEDALRTVQASRVGVPVGLVYESARRFGIKVIAPLPSADAEGLGGLFVETHDGQTVPLSEVATIQETDGPAQIRHVNLLRTVRVEVNLRGRDLVSWVGEARAKVEREVRMPNEYRTVWGGQFDNFERAKKRLSMVVPMALAIIFGMLLWMFQAPRYAVSVFALVPFALTGGVLGLVARGLSFSIPAAVGFIALAGVSVLNGVVMASAVREKLASGWPLNEALLEGAANTMRAVLTTGAVAALGFLPMALASGAGAEVQRPLATVVIAGILLSTLLTLFLLPGVLRIALFSRLHESKPAEVRRISRPSAQRA